MIEINKQSCDQVQSFIDKLEVKYLGEVEERRKDAENLKKEVTQIGAYPECLLGLDPFSYIREVVVIFSIIVSVTF